MRPLVLKENRICRQCNTNCVEDEIHHLIDCPAFNNHRKPLLDAIILLNPTFPNQTSFDKFKLIIISENNDILMLLGKFLFTSEKDRL